MKFQIIAQLFYLFIARAYAYASCNYARAKFRNAHNHFLIKLEYVLGHSKHFKNFRA